MIRASVERLAAYTPGEQPRTNDFVKLNTNENPYPPSPAVAEVLRTFDPARLRLYPDPVCGELRAKLAELHGVGPENVFVANGSDEALALCTRAFVEDDGAVGYFEPSYSLYPVLADIRVVAKRPVALGPDYDWRMPADFRASLFFLTCPNAPTGMRYPKAAIRDFCAGFEGVVLVDEAYVDFAEAHCMDLAATSDRVLVLRTLSKSYSLAGLRVGYVVGPARLIAALFKIKDSYNLDALSQRIALAAVSDGAHMRANAARIKATRARLAAALAAAGHRVYPSEANFLWVRPAAVAARALYERLKARRILIRYFAGERTGECVRITVGTDVEVDRLLEAMRELTP